MVYERVRITLRPVVGQARGDQMRANSPLAVVGMIRKHNAQQSTSGIPFGLPNTGAYLPIHVFSLPCARAYQDNGNK